MSWKDMAEEVAQHLRDQYAELRGRGLSHEDAMTANAAEIAHLNPSDWPREVRFAARSLWRERGSSLVVVITLALAMAANGIVFGLADLLILRPLPFGNAKRLVAIYGTDHEHSDGRQRLSVPDYLDIRAQSTVFEDVAAYRRGQQLTLTGAGEPTAVSAAVISPNGFRAWAVPAVVGRTIVPDDAEPGRDAAALLSHRFWSAHFGADRSIVGRTVLLNGRTHTVVGVATPDIELGNLAEIDLWVPLDVHGATARDERGFTVMGLLKPGATLAAANVELATIADRIARANPSTNAGWRLHGITLRESIAGASTWVILALLGVVVGLLLIVACANVATVMLARASARRREIAVRLALGATRGRLIRQLVSEAMLIGLASGAGGLLLAQGGLTAFKMLSPEVFFQRLSMNANLLAFGVVLSIAAPLLFGVVPALRSSRPNLNEDLKEGGRQASSPARGHRLRSSLVVTQVAFALSVLIVSGLIARTVIGLESVPLGMNPDGVLTTRVRFDPPRYATEGVRARAVDAILDRLTTVPGVSAVTAMRSLPIVEGEPRRQFSIAGAPAPERNSVPWADEAVVSPDFFSTFGVPLIAGRGWTAAESVSRPVALVNREAARRYWQTGSPVGGRVRMLTQSNQPDGPEIEIVGVVDNVLGNELSQPAPPRIYRPLGAAASLQNVVFAVRIAGEPTLVAPAIREALRAEDRDLAASEIRQARRQLADTTRTLDLVMALFIGFAGIGLIVAVTGVYGVTACVVGERRHEIGVRRALGATAGDVLRLVAVRTARLIGAGAVLGIAGGLAIGAAMRGILFGVGAADLMTHAAVLVILGVSAAVASFVPAHRAMSIDPVSVLKRE